MATKFNIIRDINGINGFGLIPSDTILSATIAANTATSLTVPTGNGMGGNGISTTPQWVAIFEFDPGISVFVAYNGATAALPAGSSFAAATSELNPQARLVAGGETISFFSATQCNVVVAFYSFS